MATPLQLCTFRLDGHLYGVEVGRVHEVLRDPPLTRIPLAEPSVRGLINLHGQLITALDLRVRLGLAPAPPDSGAMGLVVRNGQDAVVLIVDEVEDVLDVDAVAFEPTPVLLGATARVMIRGAYKLDGQLLLRLDIDEAVKIAADPKECLA